MLEEFNCRVISNEIERHCDTHTQTRRSRSGTWTSFILLGQGTPRVATNSLLFFFFIDGHINVNISISNSIFIGNCQHNKCRRWRERGMKVKSYLGLGFYFAYLAWFSFFSFFFVSDLDLMFWATDCIIKRPHYKIKLSRTLKCLDSFA